MLRFFRAVGYFFRLKYNEINDLIPIYEDQIAMVVYFTLVYLTSWCLTMSLFPFEQSGSWHGQIMFTPTVDAIMCMGIITLLCLGCLILIIFLTITLAELIKGILKSICRFISWLYMNWKEAWELARIKD